MTSELVSIIVPVYNRAHTLGMTVDSILKQTYQPIELVLIDDGSTDDSGELIDQLAEKHTNVVVVHQENRGVSAARNIGIKVANGKYISFVDSDDTICPDAIEYLMGLIKEFRTPVALTRPEARQDEEVGKDRQLIRNVVKGNELLPSLCLAGFGVYSKIYEKKVIERFVFPEGRNYEDLATVFKIIDSCERVAVGSKMIYYYRNNDVSIVHYNFSKQSFDMLTAAQEQYDYMKEHCPEAVPNALIKCVHNGTVLANQLFGSDDPKREDFYRLQNWMKMYIGDYIKSYIRDRNHVISCLAVKCGYFPAKLIFTAVQKARRNKSNG